MIDEDERVTDDRTVDELVDVIENAAHDLYQHGLGFRDGNSTSHRLSEALSELTNAVKAAEYELYVYRLWADSPVNDVTEGGLVERVRKHLELFDLEPHVVTSDVSKFDHRLKT